MPPSGEPAIVCRGLGKSYGGFAALSEVDLEVAPGEVFGFLGPNGAGKTTTIRLLMGMLLPSAGRARLLGRDCQRERVEVKRLVGYLPDDPSFPDHLRGAELLRFVAEMHGLDKARVEEILFRGLLYVGIRQALGVNWGILLSSLVFTSIHQEYGFGAVFAVGPACAWLYERTGLLSSAMALHAVHNGTTVLFKLG